MTPNQLWLLSAIGREGTITTLQLKADIGVANKFGAGVDESRLIRDLGELQRAGEIRENGGLWEVISKPVVVKPAQRQLAGMED